MNDENCCPQCGAALAADAPRELCPGCLLKRGLETGSFVTGEPTADYTPPTPDELAPMFPDLEIIEFIGRGGMGVVYKARQRRLDRLVALKILSPAIGCDPAFAERFTREAKAMAMLSHPNIVSVHDFGQTGGEGKDNLPSPTGRGAGGEGIPGGGTLYYFLMEYVDGLNLRQVLDAGTLAPKEALAIVPQICDALQYAHDHGVVHRDIKPENVLMDKEGRVKIADFGLAKLMGIRGAGLGARDSDEENVGCVKRTNENEDDTGALHAPYESDLTAAGQVLGTPQYMAPEQIKRPLEVDHRADIYSLGVVFYQMLTGELPDGHFVPPSKKVQIDVRLDEVVIRAMEKEPQRRYQQAVEMKTQVETIASTPPESATGSASAEPPDDFQHLDTPHIGTGKASGTCARTFWGIPLKQRPDGIPQSISWPGLGKAFVALVTFFVCWLATMLVKRIVRGSIFNSEIIATTILLTLISMGCVWIVLKLKSAAGKASGTPALHAPCKSDKRQPVGCVKRTEENLFTSSKARKFANVSALGFLGFLGSLGFIPKMQWCFVFSGFFFFFGLIGVAFLIESAARRKESESPDDHGALHAPYKSDKKHQQLGVAAFIFCLAGIPTSLLLAVLAGRNWSVWTFLAVELSVVIVALILGIIGRKSGAGKAAMIISAIFLLIGLGFAVFVGSVNVPRVVENLLGIEHRQSISDASRTVVDIAETPDMAAWTAYLPKGSIELVAISYHPSKDQPWWRPDGSPSGEGSFDINGNRCFPTEKQQAYEFVIRPHGLPKHSSLPVWKFPGGGASATGESQKPSGEPEKGYYCVCACYPKSIRSAVVKIGMATEPWETIYDSTSIQGFATMTGPRRGNTYWKVIFAAPIEKADGSLIFNGTYAKVDQQTRVVVIDDQGLEHLPDRQSAPSVDNTIVQLSATFHNLPLKKVKEFRFQARPYRWVEFRNVALRPNFQVSPDNPSPKLSVAKTVVVQPASLEFRILTNKQDKTRQNTDSLVEFFKNNPSKNELIDPSGIKVARWVPVKVGEEKTVVNSPDIVQRKSKRGSREITEVLVFTVPSDIPGEHLLHAEAGVSQTGRPSNLNRKTPTPGTD